MSRLLNAASVAAAGAATAAALLYLATVVPHGATLNLVSGVWIALGRDAADGLFYRPLLAAGSYGGTRYCPQLFVLIAAGLRAGLPVMRAAQLASGLGAVTMACGVATFLRRSGRPRVEAAFAAVLALVPYFVLQTTTEVRAEPLAAGWCWFGAAALQRLSGEQRWRPLLLAAAAFTLAVSAKPTLVYAGAAGVTALFLQRRGGDAIRLAALTAAGWILFVTVLQAMSHGRAIEIFRTCALAGTSTFALFAPDSVRTLLVSHLVSAVLALAVTAIAISRAWESIASVVFAAAVMASIAVLNSPGTIFINQSVEPYVAAVVVLFATGTMALRRVGPAIIVVLLVWAAAQDAREVAHLRALARPDAVAASHAALDNCTAPVLTESPLLPALAGREIVLLDPFAFRVAATRRPTLADDLATRIDRREFSCIVLEQEPFSARSRAWHQNWTFGHGILDHAVVAYPRHRVVTGAYVLLP